MAGKKIKSSEITPESVYLNRRHFIRAAALAGTTLTTAGLYRFFNPPPPKETVTAEIENVQRPENFRSTDAPRLKTLRTTIIFTNFRPINARSPAAPKISSRGRGPFSLTVWCRNRKRSP
jgi:hypothetical protein